MNEELSFWDGVEKINGKKLSAEERLQFCEDFSQMLRTSPELAKIFFNTQVYNEIVNDVTTRGAHSEGVAIVAENLASQKAKFDGKSEIDAKVSGLLAKTLGYMHDLGHTPFGHDGEGALGNEMERFEATQDYKTKRKVLFGEEYTRQAGDADVETMCYEHNETSAIIGSKLLEDFAQDNGYVLNEQAIQYIKTGILAHSTSRVGEEPKGVEQKAVRLADKIAYIPQDLLDLLKQSVISIDDLSPEEQGLLGLNEMQLTDREKEMYDGLSSEADKKQYLEQKAVRLADKIAYIPQDLLDLLKQSVISIDDLSPEEQGLLGLNEMQLTDREKEMYDGLSSEADKKQYLEQRAKSKQNLKEQLRNINSMPEKIKINLFKQLDVKVAEMQAEIARKCFVMNNGEMKLDGRKSVVDFFDKAVNKGEIPKNHEITPPEVEGISLFNKMRKAQKMPMTTPDRQTKVNETSKAYSQFLQESYGMDPMLATLWVTKAKYQDAFIKGELSRVSQDKEGNIQTETLSDINQKNDNGWKMKTTFQFFYSNIEQIPEEFRSKYQGNERDLYTNQQLVSAFIASFTNKGLNELYNGLIDRQLVISRDEAISQLQQKRPDLNIQSIVAEDKKWKNPQNPDEIHKVSANDVLEFLYEENVGNAIVSGKNQNPERNIPPIQHAIAVRDGVNATRNVEHQLNQGVELLSSAIDVSRTAVSSRDLQGMVKAVMDKQKTSEIQQHISEVKKTDEGR